MFKLSKTLVLLIVFVMLGAFVAGCGGDNQDAGNNGDENVEEVSVKEKFDSKIVGIEPGAGIMEATEQALQDYDSLEGYELVDSSGTGMVSALKKAINDEEWIVITGWTPHWKFAEWDLKFLEDPKGIYGGEEEIDTLVTPTLEEEAPAAYKMLDNFYWEPADMNAVMLDINVNEMDPAAAASKWVENNRNMVDEWIPEDAEMGKEKITLGLVTWVTEEASNNVVKQVLEEMGYTVELKSVNLGVMFQGIGEGSFDAVIGAWLPSTHKSYYEEIKDDVENLGPNLEGTLCGLVVPEYVPIDSIEEMDSTVKVKE